MRGPSLAQSPSMTIVCATHFTDSSFSAVQVAAALARVHREKLCLVSVLRGANDTDLAAQPVSDALQLQAAALKTEGIEVDTSVLHGTLGGAARQFCIDRKASMLVIGDSSQTQTALFAGLLDTLAFGVEVPLLVVRDPKPFEAWTKLQGPMKVLLALDHTWSSSLARDWVRTLAEYGNIDLIAAFIWWPADEYQRRGLVTPPIEEAHMKLMATLRSELETALKGLPENVTSRVHLEIGADHVADAILALAAREQVNLLVLGSHPDVGALARMRSVTHGVLVDAPMSVACIPGNISVPATSAVETVHTQSVRGSPISP